VFLLHRADNDGLIVMPIASAFVPQAAGAAVPAMELLLGLI
jgi:hypothetical protein